jgi:nucleoside-diphosphate-sugar epimerase
VLDLALAARRRGCLRQFVHVSTAFVCGNRSGDIFEHDTGKPRTFSNSYEQTKWEGEQLVRSLMPELPTTIVRPSIVVGDSRTGRTMAYNVLYTPLKMLYEGRLSVIPGLADAALDVVPLDYVADAIAHVALHSDETIGRTFHLTAGAGRTLSVGEIVARTLKIYACVQVSSAVRKCRFASPWLCRLMGRIVGGRPGRMWQLAEPFVAYMSAKRRFDTHNTDNILNRYGIRPPAFADYLSTILTGALENHWGRRCHRSGRAV